MEMECIIVTSGFDPEKDIHGAEIGSWEWTQRRSELAASFEPWFGNRSEDVDYLFGYREHVGYHVVLQSCSVQASPLEL
jgi:hypothetical protein